MSYEEQLMNLFRKLSGFDQLTVKDGFITLLQIQPGLSELNGWLSWTEGKEWTELTDLVKQEISRR